jgi:hypothetical protein
MSSRRRNTSRKSSNKPPQLLTNPKFSHVFRFQAGATTVPIAISSTDILGACGTIGGSAVSVYGFVAAFLIKRVQIWSPPPSQGAVSTCAIEWTGTSPVSTIEVSDTTNSVSTPAHLSSVPPRNSTAKFWQRANAIAMFNITAPPGSIIDLSLDMVLLDDAALNTVYAVATAVLGNPYYLALDGPTTHLLTPVSLSTTF